jgi:hypothetical protein
MVPDAQLLLLRQLVETMDENWAMIAVAMRLSTDPRYLDAFTKIDRAFRIAKSAAEGPGREPGAR